MFSTMSCAPSGGRRGRIPTRLGARPHRLVSGGDAARIALLAVGHGGSTSRERSTTTDGTLPLGSRWCSAMGRTSLASRPTRFESSSLALPGRPQDSRTLGRFEPEEPRFKRGVATTTAGGSPFASGLTTTPPKGMPSCRRTDHTTSRLQSGAASQVSAATGAESSVSDSTMESRSPPPSDFGPSVLSSTQASMTSKERRILNV